MADGKYILFDEGGYFFKYRLLANNGQALIISEPYKDEAACRKGIETLKKNVESLKISFEMDKNKMWCFRLITAQGRPLAQSANYKTQKLAASASESFKRFVPADKIEVSDGSKDPSHYDVQILDDAVTKSANGKFEIVSDAETNSYFYRLKANNGQVLCVSQAYASADSAQKAMEGFRKNVYEGKFYIFIDKQKKAFFKLYSSQLRLIMTGETYATKDAAVSAAKSVLKFAETAKLVEPKQ